MDVNETRRRPGQFQCATCREMLQARNDQVAMLAARAACLSPRDALCVPHLRDLLTDVPNSNQVGLAASLFDAMAAAVLAGREMQACAVCSRQDEAARRPTPGWLCLHHLRRQAGRLAWDAVYGHASRLIGVLEQGHTRVLLPALWGGDRLAGTSDDDEACAVCAARAGARIRLFEWLADAVHRFPAQAGGAAVALCGPHAWWFTDFSAGFGRMLADLAAQRWASRLRWLLAGLGRRPPDRLAARVAGLPATLASLADSEGRLHIAVIVRATAAAALRTPSAVLAQLTAAALGAEVCPVCAAENHAVLNIAASCRGIVCVRDLRLVHSANRDRGGRQAQRSATVSRLRKEAAVLREAGRIEAQ